MFTNFANKCTLGTVANLCFRFIFHTMSATYNTFDQFEAKPIATLIRRNKIAWLINSTFSFLAQPQDVWIV